MFVPPAKQRTLLPGQELLGLTSGGSQVAVEGNVSLAHGQEICTDIWNDRRARHKTPATTTLISRFDSLTAERCTMSSFSCVPTANMKYVHFKALFDDLSLQ